MSNGVRRLPVSPFEEIDTDVSNSAYCLAELLDYEEWIEDYLRLESRKAFKATEDALEARRAQLDKAREGSYITARGVQQLGVLVVATVKEMEAEFTRRSVADIGCGVGRFGEAIARNAKASVTFVDTDEKALANIGPHSGTKIVADGKALPLENKSFERTVVSFSTLSWAASPMESALAFNEAVRVTKPDGSVFFIPAFSNILKRLEYIRLAEQTGAFKRIPEDVEDSRALKVWAAQDYVVLKSLTSLIKNDRASITWHGYMADGQFTGTTMDHWSAIVDMHDSVPREELAENLALAQSFMA